MSVPATPAGAQFPLRGADCEETESGELVMAVWQRAAVDDAGDRRRAAKRLGAQQVGSKSDAETYFSRVSWSGTRRDVGGG